MDISSFIFGDQPEDTPDVSEQSVQKMYDRVTSKLISDTPGPGDAIAAIASVRPVNPLAVMNGRYSAEDTMPSAIMRVQQAAKLKEARETMALLGDMEAHEAAKARIVNEQARLAFDKTKFFALQGAKGLGAVYKTYIDISARMDETAANDWLNSLMEGDIDSEGPLVDEGEGRAYALRKLVEVGGIRQKRTAPAGFHYEGDSLVVDPGYLQGKAAIAAASRESIGEAVAKAEATARVRAKYRDPGDSLEEIEQKEEVRQRVRAKYQPQRVGTLYRIENEEGEAEYVPAAEAVGKKPAPTGKKSRFNFSSTPEQKKTLPDPLGIR